MSSLTVNVPVKRDPAKEGVLKDIRQEISVDDRYYQVVAIPSERLLYLYDITELVVLRERYEEEKLAIGIVMMDNLDEAAQGMDDQQRTSLIAKVASEITEWSKQFEVYLRRLSSERYLMLLNHRSLQALEESRFVVLDEVREMTADLKVPMTLSIGLAYGSESASELERWRNPVWIWRWAAAGIRQPLRRARGSPSMEARVTRRRSARESGRGSLRMRCVT